MLHKLISSGYEVKNKLDNFWFTELEYYMKMNEKILFMPTKKRSKLLSETIGDLVEYLLKTDDVHFIHNNYKNYPTGTWVCESKITKTDNPERNALV